MTTFTDAQRMVLSSAFHEGGGIWEYVPPEALDDPYHRIALVLQALHVRGEPVDIASFTSECLSRGIDPAIHRWMMGPVSVANAHAVFIESRGHLLINGALARAHQHIERGVEPWRVVDEMIADIHAIPRPVTERPCEWWTWDEMLAVQAEQEESWVLPKMLRQGERCVLTGAEGHGKSTLIYQMAIGAAYGVSVLDTDDTYQPQRVMILDVENWHETQVAGHMRTMGLAYGRFRPHGFTPNVALLKTRIINLLAPEQRRGLLDAVDAFQPNLLVMGSGYKLVDVADDWRVMATSIQRTADEARARSGCAVIIETHAGHGVAGDRNGWRPDGSSYWLRWPEFGLGLEPLVKERRKTALVHHWRGDRVTGREWPGAWRAGGLLPWTPMTEDEVDALDSA